MAVAKVQTDPKVEALSLAISSLTEATQTINKRLSEMEQEVARLIPRESLVPSEVWASLGQKEVIASAMIGAVQGMCSNAPLHNLNKPDTQEVYAKIAFDLTEKILVQYGLRMNQTMKKEQTDEQDSE